MRRVLLFVCGFTVVAATGQIIIGLLLLLALLWSARPIMADLYYSASNTFHSLTTKDPTC